MRRFGRLLYGVTALTTLAMLAPVASGHETDHYTLTPARETAEQGDYLTKWVYQALAGTVEEANRDARAAAERGDAEALAEIGTQDYVFEIAWQQFPAAYFVIENLETRSQSAEQRARHPGRVVAHKPETGGLYSGAYLPVDIRQLFRVWHASVIKAHGVYFGTDKIGHFTDMGKNYYNAYRDARRDGASEDEAVAAAVDLGTEHPVFAESALLGFWTAGGYSNGDLAANYAGFLFYRNLAEPVDVAGHTRPPLLKWDGRQWSLADHVRPDSDFLAWFITDHWDEALNPSLYEISMRDGIRRNIRDRASHVLWRYRDVNGERRPPTWFVDRAIELSTFAGDDYGHRGSISEVVTLADTFEAFNGEGLEAVDLNARNDRGHTPLHDAVAWGRLGDVRELLLRGADVDARVRSDEPWPGEAGCTPLHIAARTGRVSIVRLLIENGAVVDARDDRGASVTHHAAGQPEAMALLLEAGAPIDSRTREGRTPLHWAAAKDDATSAEYLLERGARADAADAAGRTPLHDAAAHASAETAAALTVHGQPGDAHGVHPLHVAAGRSDADAPEVVGTLLNARAEPNARDNRGRTPLHEAARSGRLGSLAALAEHGGRLDERDTFGTTALHLAAREGRESTGRWLVNHGARVNPANAAGVTPLHEAAFAGRERLVDRLVAAGADPRIRDANSRTPAAVANSRGFDGLSRRLEDRAAAYRLAERP